MRENPTKNTNFKPEPELNKTQIIPPPPACGLVDFNKKEIDELCEYLENKHKYSSSGESHAIFRLIDFYKKWKDGFKPEQHEYWIVTEISGQKMNKFTGKNESNIIGITNNKNKLSSFLKNNHKYKVEKIKFF